MEKDFYDGQYKFVIHIDPPIKQEDIDDEVLEMYIENNLKSGETRRISFSPSRSYAVIELSHPVDDISLLQKKLDQKPLENYKVVISGAPVMDKILVTDFEKEQLGQNLEDSVVALYFENKRKCPMGGAIKEFTILPCQCLAIVQFEDPTVAEKVVAVSHTIGGKTVLVKALTIWEYLEQTVCDRCQQKKQEPDESVPEVPTEKSYISPSKKCYYLSATEKSYLSDTGMTEEANQYNSAETNSSDTGMNSKQLHDDSGDGCFTGGNDDALNQDHNLSYFCENDKEQTKYPTVRDALHSKQTKYSSSSAEPKIYRSSNADGFELLSLTLNYKRLPDLQPEEYCMETTNVRSSDLCFEFKGPEEATGRIKKAMESLENYGEVSLSEYTGTSLAKLLNCTDGEAWIKDLFTGLKIPALLRSDQSGLTLKALNLETAREAAETVKRSLLPAVIQCGLNQITKALITKELNGKVIKVTEIKSVGIQLIGIPLHVIKAVHEIESKLHDKRSGW